jgi:uncharacterized protein YcbX
MARIRTAFTDDGFLVTAPNGESLHLPFGLVGDAHKSCVVKIWADTVEATLADTSINIWFSELMGFACGLVYLADHQHRPLPNETANFDDEVSFADGAPVLVISDASLAELNRRLKTPVGIERFRPNLLVTADEPHAEDGWRSVTIGDAKLDVGWPCSRCILTTVDPETGDQDPDREPLNTLEAYRRKDRSVHFGQNLIPRTLGTIRTGADLLIDAIIKP